MSFLLIPYTRLTIKTYLSVQNAEKLLAANVGKRPFISWSWPFNSANKLPFLGTVGNGRFNITRAINYRNSFQPVITGQFHDDLDVTRIEISMRLHYFVIVFLVFFLSMLFFNSISLFLSPYLSSIDRPFLQFITSVGSVGLFLYLLTMLPFNYEARRAQQELEKLFPS